jgi:PhzF family phenazine biosynthesis protein
MTVQVFQVDSFTDVPFAGNPAGVCLMEAPREPAWMQAVAREMNCSETAFVVPAGDCLDLRWFTPAVEVELCGHATLAAAHVLWTEGGRPAGRPARFATRSGVLVASRRGEAIELDFPAKPLRDEPAPQGLADALGVEPLFSGMSHYDALVAVDSEDTVRRIAPDISRLRSLPVRGIIVTARSSDPRFDFVSRFFAPAVGIDEDPVTGSAHCVLGPFWSDRLGRNELVGYQASARGGVVGVRVAGDRVILIGRAVTVLRGEVVA